MRYYGWHLVPRWVLPPYTISTSFAYEKTLQPTAPVLKAGHPGSCSHVVLCGVVCFVFVSFYGGGGIPFCLSQLLYLAGMLYIMVLNMSILR